MAAALTGHLTHSRIGRIAALMRSGGVVVLPTDTIYGLHCDSSRADAIERIVMIKGRRRERGLILLAADLLMAERVVASWPGESRELLEGVWPAPLTAILPARARLAAAIAPRGAVAVRVPAHAMIRSLIRAIGSPIVSTSANESGGRPFARIADIKGAFPGLDAYISRRGRSRSLASTIVDFTGAEPRLVRAGGVHWPLRTRRSCCGVRVGYGAGQSGKPSKCRSL